MSLREKIVLSFLVSVFIIGMLSAFLYLNFIEIKKETAFLELTDTIRSKSLQLRRHEKNYFLYGPLFGPNEAEAIYKYLGELDDILNGIKSPQVERASSFKDLVERYRRQFGSIETLVNEVTVESQKLKTSLPGYSRISRMVEGNFLDKPLEDVKFLQETYLLPTGHKLLSGLQRLNAEINELRSTGEGIITVSKELDKTARENVDNFIRMSRIAIIVFFPLFVVVGLGTILFITGSIVKRLQLLTGVVEKTGKGGFSPMPVSTDKLAVHDEVETLVRKFNTMEEQLSQREKELIQSKKLAAIGTLASGVAHELNNPLNNIYTTAQRLIKKSGDECPEFIKKGLDDIFGQTMRVKSIVGDLLEFARGREPHLMAVELRGLIAGIYKNLSGSAGTKRIKFSLELHPEEVVIYADTEQLERVFLNLFSNAIDAISDEGELRVRADEEDSFVRIMVSDTGAGMPREMVEKIFEPFYTTKDKGTGLGLAIVFNIIQRHHGEIHAESAEGKGTTFIITLPKGKR